MNNNIDILFATDMNKSRPWYRDRIPGIVQAIKEIEHTVELMDIYELLGNHKYKPTNTDERKSFLQTYNLIKANKIFEENIIEFMPKVFVLGTADNYREFLIPKTIENIRQKGIIVIGILGDDEFNYPKYRFLLGWFDLFMAYVKPCLNYYEDFNLSNGYYLPNSCYLNNKEFDNHSQETEYDVILVGAPIANRPEIAQALIDAGLNLAIYGSKKWTEYDFVKNYYYGFIPTEDFDSVLAKGKIVLALLEDHITGKLHMNTKIWEAVRVARVPIATYYEPLLIDYKLTDGVDILMYKNIKELVEKVIYYSSNEKERIEIAKNIYSRVQNEFNYSLLYKDFFNFSLTLKQKNITVDFEEYLNQNHNIRYLKSPNICIDNEVVNHIKIIEQLNKGEQKIDYIYYSKIECNKRIIQKWPFIDFNSIIFFKKKGNKFAYIPIFLLSYIRGRTIYINQFCIISEHKTITGRLNLFIEKKIIPFIKKCIKRSK